MHNHSLYKDLRDLEKDATVPIMTCLIFDQILSFSKPRYQGKRLGTARNIHGHVTGAQ